MDFSPNKNRFLNLKFLLGSTLYKNYYLPTTMLNWLGKLSYSLFSPFTHSLFPLSSHISEKRRVQNGIAFRQRTNSICLLTWLTDVHTRTSKKFRVIFFYYAIIILNYILGLWWHNKKNSVKMNQPHCCNVICNNVVILQSTYLQEKYVPNFIFSQKWAFWVLFHPSLKAVL